MYIKTGIKAIMVMTLIMGISYAQASLLPDINDIPLRNPFRSGLRYKVGPLPTLLSKQSGSTLNTPTVKWLWSNRLTLLSEGLSLYPKILPALDEKWLYRADHKGHVVAINKKTGKVAWRIKTPHAISAGPTIVMNSLYLTTQDAKLIAVSKNTGKLEWIVDIPSESLASVVGNEKLIAVHTIDGKITGLNPQNGEVLWTYECMLPQLMLRGSGITMIGDDMLLAGTASGK